MERVLQLAQGLDQVVSHCQFANGRGLARMIGHKLLNELPAAPAPLRRLISPA
jgi:hypothetical protein